MLAFLLASVVAFAAQKTEVQVNICESSTSLYYKLNLDHWQEEDSEESVFIEAPRLELYRQGWVFRVRFDYVLNTAEVIVKHNQADVADWTEQKKCEFDMHGSAQKSACKMSYKIRLGDYVHAKEAKDFIGLLSGDQASWLAAEGAAMPASLMVTTSFKTYSYSNKVQGQKLEVGITENEQGKQFIEISTRVKSEEALAAQTKLLKYLQQKEVVLCAEQSAIMTKLKLESYFGATPIF